MHAIFIIVACLLLVAPGGSAGSEPRAEKDLTIYSTGGVDSDGRRHSLKIKRSFVAGASWDLAALDGPALKRVLEVSKQSLVDAKLAQREDITFQGIEWKMLGEESVVFARFRFKNGFYVSVAVNAVFDCAVPTLQ